MAFFKLNKNKTASAAPSPAQTPRSSMQASRPSNQNKMTPEQALEELLKDGYLGGPATSMNSMLIALTTSSTSTSMTLFKFLKKTNKASSAASMPVRESHSSVEYRRLIASNDKPLTPEQVADMLSKNGYVGETLRSVL
ncbi:hypothetical protein DFQ27_008181 [Actinomortierella ambigua]|uniref:Uncharacterized protein n=1 Tax=Actinomortierella ambigua TaxID=1343610 RepID=A0A9P6UBF5_9FUNG|nr:hypothetical protein DFQ27_008181 [Actinomortierella ambigua]